LSEYSLSRRRWTRLNNISAEHIEDSVFVRQFDPLAAGIVLYDLKELITEIILVDVCF